MFSVANVPNFATLSFINHLLESISNGKRRKKTGKEKLIKN